MILNMIMIMILNMIEIMNMRGIGERMCMDMVMMKRVWVGNRRGIGKKSGNWMKILTILQKYLTDM